MHPLAGTRPRGATPEEDARLAAELLADPKERAEHVMLVDLGPQRPGSGLRARARVDVVDFMRVERYSHVMHMVSTVFGEVQPGRDALDVLTATFPAGTCPGRRSRGRWRSSSRSSRPAGRCTAARVGYLDAAGDMDMAIAIRTAVLHRARPTSRPAPGSSPTATRDRAGGVQNKAAAVLRAVAAAATLRRG